MKDLREQLVMEEYLDDFLSEFRQALASINASLDALESAPDDITEINSLYRNAHNMKGGSNAMGFPQLGAFFLAIERLIAPYRDGGKPISGKVTGAIRVASASLGKAHLTIRLMKSDRTLSLENPAELLNEAADHRAGPD